MLHYLKVVFPVACTCSVSVLFMSECVWVCLVYRSAVFMSIRERTSWYPRRQGSVDKASWVKTESLSEEQELDVSSHDGEYCSKGVDRSKYWGERKFRNYRNVRQI